MLDIEALRDVIERRSTPDPCEKLLRSMLGPANCQIMGYFDRRPLSTRVEKLRITACCGEAKPPIIQHADETKGKWKIRNRGYTRFSIYKPFSFVIL